MIEFGFDALVDENGMRKMMIQLLSPSDDIIGDIRIPVPYNDSMSVMQKDAKAKLQVFLEHALNDLSNEEDL